MLSSMFDMTFSTIEFNCIFLSFGTYAVKFSLMMISVGAATHRKNISREMPAGPAASICQLIKLLNIFADMFIEFC